MGKFYAAVNLQNPETVGEKGELGRECGVHIVVAHDGLEIIVSNEGIPFPASPDSDTGYAPTND